MTIEKVKIEEVKLNPNNPRTIRDDKFKKLVKSIGDFPEMLDIRPIVVDENMIVLGGNMRLKACKEVGLKEVSIIKFKGLTEQKKKEFLIKDNVNYGDWDYMMLENTEFLDEWGMDLPDWISPTNNDDDFSEWIGLTDFVGEETSNRNNIEQPEERREIDATCILINLPIDDWQFYKKMEGQLLTKLGVENISDAFKQMIKKQLTIC
jgi:hypothetical protein